MRNKVLSFSHLEAFRNCPWEYFHRLKRRYRAPISIYEVVGQATHAVAAAPERKRKEVLERHLQGAPAGEREKTEALVLSQVAQADEMIVKDRLQETSKEKTLSWTDPVTGWELRAAPDEIGSIVERRRVVLQISELKTCSRIKRRHRRQLYFFGLVASLALDHKEPVRLVLRLLGNSSRDEFWYSPLMTEQSLGKVRSAIGRIETFLASVEDADTDASEYRDPVDWCQCKFHAQMRERRQNAQLLQAEAPLGSSSERAGVPGSSSLHPIQLSAA